MNPSTHPFRQLLRHRLGFISLILLVIIYIVAILAPFLSPYDVSTLDLKKTYHPPTRLLWKDSRIHVQIYENINPTSATYAPAQGKTTPLHFFVQSGTPYRLLGLFPCQTRLFSVDKEERIYLLGSDSTGRDVFSRLLMGSRISLTIGLVGVAITMGLGIIIGGLSGYFGGFLDDISMRVTELLMAIPGLYLLLALRATLAQHFSSDQIFFLIVVILSFIGWSGTARVVRGLVLSLRQRPFILAAESMGQTPWKILWKHLFPNIFSYLIIAATLSVPSYILNESALSFLNIGIQDPDTSWGLMLKDAQDMKVFMLGFWWLLLPGGAIFVTVIAFNLLGDALRDIVDPKFRMTN